MLWVGWLVFQFYVEQPVTGDILVNVPAVVACHCKLSVFQRLPDFFKLPEDISFVFPNTSSHHLKVDHWTIQESDLQDEAQRYIWTDKQKRLSWASKHLHSGQRRQTRDGPTSTWTTSKVTTQQLSGNLSAVKHLQVPQKQTSCF